MLYAQFFCLSTGYPDGIKKRTEACGSWGVCIIDARLRKDTQHALAVDYGRKHKWIAYQLHKGESFSRSSPVSDIINL